MVIAPAQNRLLVVQARRAKFLTANSHRNDLAYASGSVVPRRRYVEGCTKVIRWQADLDESTTPGRLEWTMGHTRWTMQH
jgi:hypothetical protein